MSKWGEKLALFAETPVWELGEASSWEEGAVPALLAFGTKRQLPPTDFLLRPPPPPQPTAPAALPGNQGTKSPAQGVPRWRLRRERGLKKVWTSPAELWLQPGQFPELLMNVQFEKEVIDTPAWKHTPQAPWVHPANKSQVAPQRWGHCMIPPSRSQVQESLSGLKKDRLEVSPPTLSLSVSL